MGDFARGTPGRAGGWGTGSLLPDGRRPAPGVIRPGQGAWSPEKGGRTVLGIGDSWPAGPVPAAGYRVGGGIRIASPTRSRAAGYFGFQA
jgi:hypothetical protein